MTNLTRTLSQPIVWTLDKQQNSTNTYPLNQNLLNDAGINKSQFITDILIELARALGQST